MPTYKLYYFDAKARGELARLIFAAAGKDYEDHRIQLEEWKKGNTQSKMPFGKMPVLEIDGKHMLCQSYAIARYLAQEFGLAGKDKGEVAQADMYVGVIDDLFTPCVGIQWESDETQKAEKVKKYKDETAKLYLPKIDDILGKNSSGFIVGNSLTYADLAFIVVQDFMEDVLKKDAEEILAPYANLRKHRLKIRSLPKIAAWISKRPANSL